jgi:hypothetical protein
MFTDPPLATIGAHPSDAMVVGSASYVDQGRAKVEARNGGLVRIYVSSDTGIITGAAPRSIKELEKSEWSHYWGAVQHVPDRSGGEYRLRRDREPLHSIGRGSA